MRVWLVSVAVLFVLVEIYLSLKEFILPLPIYIMAGALLAIASNYEKGIMALFRQESSTDGDIITQNAALIEERKALKAENPKIRENISSLTNN